MSHYIVNVFLPNPANAPVVPGEEPFTIDELLAKALFPFDENRDVPPYREYWTEAKPEDHWYYKILVEDGYLTSNQIGTLSWRDYLEAFIKRQAEKYYDGSYSAYYEAEGQPFYDEKTGTVYEMSTYNPQSKWDWYVIGGRWVDRYPVRFDLLPNPQLIGGTAAFGVEPGFRKPGNVDGGPVFMIDWEKMRADKVEMEDGVYSLHEQLVAKHGYPTLWSYFAGKVEAGEMTWEEARQEYGSQGYVREKNAVSDGQVGPLFWRDPEEFLGSREEFLQQVRDQACGGFASLTLEGEWVEPGKMGWFGMSTDDDASRVAYHKWFNEYITTIPQDTIVVAVDVHI